MGRLPLNVLFSFAQFKREVTAERIRDKIAASKHNGYWMGGLPPLGYDRHPDPQMRTLVINEAEAAIVREIFNLYKEHDCLRQVEMHVIGRGCRSKRRTFANGKSTGARRFRRGQINFLLRNPIYIARVRHKQKSFEGLHVSIIENELWDVVQARLDQKSPKKIRGPSKSGALLTSRIVDETGDVLTPTHAQKANRRYRYYVSARLLTGMSSDVEGWRLPAQPLETAVADSARRHINAEASRLLSKPNPTNIGKLKENIEGLVGKAVLKLVERVAISPGQLRTTLSAEAIATCCKVPETEIDRTRLQFQALFQLRRRGNEARLIIDGTISAPDHKLIRMMALTHSWLEEIKCGVRIKDIAARYEWPSLMIRQRIKLAFLSPRIVAAILEGRQPDELTLTSLIKSEIPLDWDTQWLALGFGGAA